MKNILLCSFFALIISNASAQTWTNLNANLNGSITSVFITPQGKVIVAGKGGFFATSTDDGETWTVTDASDGEDIEDVFFFNENDGIILLRDASLLTSDGGLTFPLYSPMNDDMRDFTFSDNTHGWAVGKDGVLMNTTDGGNLWVDQGNIIDEDLEAVSFSDNNNGLIVGKNNLAIRTTDGGNNWVDAEASANEDFTTTFFADVNHAWIAGRNGEILHTSNSGNSWTSQFSPVDEDFSAMYFLDGSNGFIAGKNGTIISTTDGGNNWNLNSTDVSVSINAIFIISPDKGFAVGDNGTVLKLGSISTSVTEINQVHSIQISPNPASDFIKIEWSSNKISRVDLMDASGKLIQTLNLTDHQTEIFIKPLHTGIYYLQTTDADGIKTISKVIKD